MAGASALGQSIPQTPNLKLNLPPTGTPNWGNLINQNFVTLDTVVGGLQRSYQGTWSGTINYQMGQMVIFNGSTYTSLLAGNQGNQPDRSPTAWGLIGTVSVAGNGCNLSGGIVNCANVLMASVGPNATYGTSGYLQGGKLFVTGFTGTSPFPVPARGFGDLEWVYPGQGPTKPPNGALGLFGFSNSSNANNNGGVSLWGDNATGLGAVVYQDCEMTGCVFNVPTQMGASLNIFTASSHTAPAPDPYKATIQAQDNTTQQGGDLDVGPAWPGSLWLNVETGNGYSYIGDGSGAAQGEKVIKVEVDPSGNVSAAGQFYAGATWPSIANGHHGIVRVQKGTPLMGTLPSGHLPLEGQRNSTPKSPANGRTSCRADAMWHDDSYLYVCTASGTVKRVALGSF